VIWDCDDDPDCAYQRCFKTEEEAHAFAMRVRFEGCPNDLYYLDEEAGDSWRQWQRENAVA